jgi:hypothetical protein
MGREEEIHARLAQLRMEIEGKRAEIETRVTEVNELLAELHGGDGDPVPAPPFLKLLQGGRSALAAPAAALRRRPRHPLTVATAFAVFGAMAAILLVPTKTSTGGPGDAMVYPSIPIVPTMVQPSAVPPRNGNASAPVRPTLAPSSPQQAPTGGATTPAALPSVGVPRPSSQAPTTPAPGGPSPSSAPGSPSAGPSSSSPSSSPRCVVKVTLTGVIEVCVR